MNVAFYFDPCCPFCWITSRWLLHVKEHRGMHIDWVPFSLALKNQELPGHDAGHTEHAPSHLSAHRVLRVMYAAATKEKAPMEAMYTAFGRSYHIGGKQFYDDEIIETLEELHLPKTLLQEADSAIHDHALQTYVDEAVAIVGEDIGVPTIVFEDEAGQKTGFFGPVLQSLPSEEESLEIWDGMTMLAGNDSFYELKRCRPTDGPDVLSTK